MSSVLRFPLANPIRIAILDMDGINTNNIDNNLWHVLSLPRIESFCQPWVKADNLQFQFHTSFDNNFVELVRASDDQVIASDDVETEMLFEDSEEMLFEDSVGMRFEGADDALSDIIYTASSSSPAYETRMATIDFATLDVTVGKYYIQVYGSHTDGATYYARSEIIDIQVEQRNTVLFTYYNNEPAFDMDYRESTFNPVFRVRADFIKPADETDFDNITSAESLITKVNDITSEGRFLETLEDMPAWMYQKINRILGHDYVDIDGVQVQGTERFGMDFEVTGRAWINFPQSIPVPFKQSTAYNRHDSGTRVTFS